VACPALPYFSTLSHRQILEKNREIFEKKTVLILEKIEKFFKMKMF